MRSAKAGYTLLEMLLSVAIFAGLVILIMATFARTASSSAKVNALREKSSVARALMGQITTDFRYIYTDQPFTDPDVGVSEHYGYGISPSETTLVMLLQFPGDNNTSLVKKKYTVVPSSASADLRVVENRECTIVSSTKAIECDAALSGSGEQSLLGGGYVLNYDFLEPVFSGKKIDKANVFSPVGFLTVTLSLKPKDHQTNLCSSLPVGTCYRVQTTLSSGDKT